MKYKQKKKIKKILFVIIVILVLLGIGLFTYKEIKKHQGLTDVTGEFNKILSIDDAKNITTRLVKEKLNTNDITVTINKSIENRIEATYTINNINKNVIVIYKDNNWIIDNIEI